jgi:hypothetical protein
MKISKKNELRKNEDMIIEKLAKNYYIKNKLFNWSIKDEKNIKFNNIKNDDLLKDLKSIDFNHSSLKTRERIAQLTKNIADDFKINKTIHPDYKKKINYKKVLFIPSKNYKNIETTLKQISHLTNIANKIAKDIIKYQKLDKEFKNINKILDNLTLKKTKQINFIKKFGKSTLQSKFIQKKIIIALSILDDKKVIDKSKEMGIFQNENIEIMRDKTRNAMRDKLRDKAKGKGIEIDDGMSL